MHRPPASAFRTPLDVHVWRVEASAQGDGLEGCLSAEERERTARFAFEADRRLFIARRAALRHVLCRYAGGSPRDIRLTCDAQGKPRLDGTSSIDLRFNVTHSAGRCLIAVSPGRRIGVDLESCTRAGPVDEVAEAALSAQELAAWRALPADFRPAAFLRAWTCKEALLKATGQGLSHRPSGVAVPARLPAAVQWEGSTWSLAELQSWPGFAAALAIEGDAPHVTLYEWPDGRLTR